MHFLLLRYILYYAVNCCIACRFRSSFGKIVIQPFNPYRVAHFVPKGCESKIEVKL
jgi:hypothetical protein